jgi:hypothetical protein
MSWASRLNSEAVVMRSEGNRKIVLAHSRKTYTYEVHAILWLSRKYEALITELLSRECKIPRNAIQHGMRLTVYHGRRALSGLVPVSRRERIAADALETRFMVLAPGGENPRPEHEPSRRSVGIRLTKRNQAIRHIQRLRASIYRLETPAVIGERTPTSAWINCFGARHYQPHIKLLRPGSGIERDLTKLGEIFRSDMEWIEFDRFEIRCGSITSSPVRHLS